MNRQIIGSFVLVSLVAAWPAIAQTTAPAKSPAVQSLTHSAQSLAHQSSAPARAGRMVTLTSYAYKLDPADPEAMRMMTDIAMIQGDKALATEIARNRLDQNPADHAIGMAYLMLNVEALSSADKRLEFLAKAAASEKLTPHVRAEALTQEAQILLGRNQKKEAQAKLQQALKLEPRTWSALVMTANLAENPTPVMQCKMLCQLLQANPSDIDAAWQIAPLLADAGLHDQAAIFYDFAWEMTRRLEGSIQNETLVVMYINSLLDAGMARRAVEFIVPLRKQLGQSVEIQSLLIEAYRQAGQASMADQVAQEMHQQLSREEGADRTSVESYKKTAWYYLVNDLRSHSALAYARNAAKGIPHKDASLELILAAAELRAGDAAKGEAALKAMIDTQPYAATFLAVHYYNNNQPEQGKEAILAGSKFSRRGRAFRTIADLANRQNVAIAPAANAKELAQNVSQMDVQSLNVALFPQKFISVQVKPLHEQRRPGEPLEVEATLANVSEVEIPIGPNGLLNPSMSLRVMLSNGLEFNDLPVLSWPAPRYLKPGQSLTARVRLDVGDLEQWLVRHPLDDVSMRIIAVLDPIQRDKLTVSALPTVVVRDAGIQRLDMLVPFDRAQGDWAQAYQLTLGYIVKDLKQGQLPERMAAVRQIGSLLTLQADVGARRATLPRQLVTAISQPVLLSMLKAAMEDPAPEVRAQAVASLIYCRTEGRIIRLLGAYKSDPSELVRLRLAELLGIMGQTKDLAGFAGDTEPVRQMISAFKGS